MITTSDCWKIEIWLKNIENVYEKSTKEPAAGEKLEKLTIILGKKHKYCVKKY